MKIKIDWNVGEFQRNILFALEAEFSLCIVSVCCRLCRMLSDHPRSIDCSGLEREGMFIEYVSRIVVLIVSGNTELKAVAQSIFQMSTIPLSYSFIVVLLKILEEACASSKTDPLLRAFSQKR